MRLAILGASGHGKVVADTALQGVWRDVVFFDDAWPQRRTNGRWQVAGDTNSLLGQLMDFDGALVAIGNNLIRLQKLTILEARGARLATVVHPRTAISRFAALGTGTVVFAGAVIQVDSKIGKGCIVNTSASVDHDCELDDGVHVCPGANLAGGVRIGRGSWVGIGSSVKQLVRVGNGATIGAGAVVVDDVPDGVTVVGVPARVVVR